MYSFPSIIPYKQARINSNFGNINVSTQAITLCITITWLANIKHTLQIRNEIHIRKHHFYYSGAFFPNNYDSIIETLLIVNTNDVINILLTIVGS